MPDLPIRHLDRTQQIAKKQARRVQAAWSDLEMGSAAASFTARVEPVIMAAITTGQTQAAALAPDYVDGVMAAEGGGPRDPDGAFVRPVSFGGFGADGSPLEEIANRLLVRLLSDRSTGMSDTDASLRGQIRAVMWTANEITDAGRTATRVQMVADERVAGHERVVKLPACRDCILLAGKLYRYSTGFQRHPRCDCTMKPVTLDQWHDGNPDNDPRSLFESMSKAQQDQAFGPEEAEAIRLGADISQVVNASKRKAMSTVEVFGRKVEATSYGTTVRALFGGYEIRSDGTLRKRRASELERRAGQRYRRAKTPRLTAGQIVRMGESEGWTREELIRQLRRFAYLI